MDSLLTARTLSGDGTPLFRTRHQRVHALRIGFVETKVGAGIFMDFQFEKA